MSSGSWFESFRCVSQAFSGCYTNKPPLQDRHESVVPVKREPEQDDTQPHSAKRGNHSSAGTSFDEAIDLTGED
jgi:hypothetical protein